jgi:mRNA-degrading endonuclease toxin of MazEF toxin-antitoxin module
VKPFDIYSWQPAGWPEPHPAVIVSHPDRVTAKPEVEVLMCSSKKAGRMVLPGEIMLDEADGLDWPTLCKCDLIHAVSKQDLTHRRGEVFPLRRAPMIRLIIAAHAWGAILAGE